MPIHTLATEVFPQPGGPTSKTPAADVIPTAWYNSGRLVRSCNEKRIGEREKFKFSGLAIGIALLMKSSSLRVQAAVCCERGVEVERLRS